jgi:hypothetical protein
MILPRMDEQPSQPVADQSAPSQMMLVEVTANRVEPGDEFYPPPRHTVL